LIGQSFYTEMAFVEEKIDKMETRLTINNGTVIVLLHDMHN
jgi:hypothetical protein